jgi:esterase/lipase superfamily enzyme
MSASVRGAASIRGGSRSCTAALLVVCALALSGCNAIDMDGSMRTVAAAPRPSVVQVFIASTREGEKGAASQKSSSEGTHYALATLSLPPSHQVGAIESPMWGSANAKDHVVVAGERDLDADEFRAEFASHVSGRIGVNRDVLVYVHGFNTSFEESRLRAGQIVADSHFGGVPVLFTWPTKAQVFGYVSDKDSAMASRDALQDVLTEVSATPGVGKIHILAHSMGGWLAMEALRQAALSGHRDLEGHLGEVMLASPDIDMEVFESQMARIRPANVTVFATANDRALSLSSALAQSRQRVGAINPANAEDRSKIEAAGAKVYDLSSASAGFIDHDAYAVAPAVLRSIGAEMAKPRAGETNTVSIIDASGYAEKSPN